MIPRNQRNAASDLTARNQAFYDRLWTEARLIRPERFATWPLVRCLSARPGCRLEIGPGLRPRLPVLGTFFLDLSRPALGPLRGAGGAVVYGAATHLPFPGRCFTLLCALDVIEHVADDEAVLRELARVAVAGAVLLVSVPLHPSAWTSFDEIVGHARRYDPGSFVGSLARHGFRVERSAAFGMRPRSSRLTGLGMWFLAHRRGVAMRWYNRLLMPLALRRQPPLRLRPGVMEAHEVDELFLVCRRVA